MSHDDRTIMTLLRRGGNVVPRKRQGAWATHLAKTARRLAKLALKLDRLEEELTRIADDLQLLIETSDDMGSFTVNGPPGSPGTRRGRSEREANLRRLAQAGVDTVVMTRHADGSATVEIEKYPPLNLTPMLADLLKILCLHSGDSEIGPLAEYKPLADLALRLGERAGKDVSRHAVTQLVSRLRAALEESGGNRYLVQTNRRHGCRFALRRGGRLVIVGDHV
jgi:hypothetical protein